MDSAQLSTSFKSLVGPTSNLKIVDIGASPLDGADAPYASLVEAGDAALIAFDPHGLGYTQLAKSPRPNELFIQKAVGDGLRHTFRLCHAPGMSSLLPPDPAVLTLFHKFAEFGQVVSAFEVDTVRLDDVPETIGADLLKIDIQGAELLVLANALNRLESLSVIHTEVLFLPMYKDQPLFSEIEMFLRGNGFAIHGLQHIERRTVTPLLVNQDPYGGLNQVLWADAIFIRDLTRLDLYSDRQLLVTANLVHDLYKSFDVSLCLLMELDRRLGTSLANKYWCALKSGVGERNLNHVF